jgi:hypothetical protein
MAQSWPNLPCALTAAILKKKRTLAILAAPTGACGGARTGGKADFGNPLSEPPGHPLGCSTMKRRRALAIGAAGFTLGGFSI